MENLKKGFTIMMQCERPKSYPTTWLSTSGTHTANLCPQDQGPLQLLENQLPMWPPILVFTSVLYFSSFVDTVLSQWCPTLKNLHHYLETFLLGLKFTHINKRKSKTMKTKDVPQDSLSRILSITNFRIISTLKHQVKID